MKKFIALSITVVLALCLCSCGNKPEQNTTTPFSSATTTDEKEIFTEKTVDCQELYYYSIIKEQIEKLNNETEALPIVSENTDAVFHYRYPRQALHASNKGGVPLDDCLGLPFVNLISQTKANPFHAFDTLVSSQLVSTCEPLKSVHTEKGLLFDLYNISKDFQAPSPEQKSFSFAQEGCEDFTQQLVAGVNSATHNSDILNADLCSEAVNLIHYSEEDNCYYSFFISYDTSYAYITALYYSSDNNEYINNVKLEVMFIDYPVTNCDAGISEYGHIKNGKNNYDMLNVMACIESLCTGSSYAGDKPEINTSTINENFKEYAIPFSYEVKGYKAELARNDYTTNSETKDYFVKYTYTLTEN